VKMDIRRKKFCELYVESGNAKQSYIKAGYSAKGRTAEVNSSRMLRKTEVHQYINELNEKLETKSIADISQIKQFWTEVMFNEDIELRDRLRASEYLAKTCGAFIEKKEVLGNLNNNIEVIFVDPTEDI
jgi:phage terminase small subunit